MTIAFCPRCRKRIGYMENTDDFVHSCDSGITTLDNEDVFIIGNWEDYTGSQNIPPKILQTAGTQNKIAGTTGGIEGGKVESYTNRGAPKSRWRTRQHLQYIELKKQN